MSRSDLNLADRIIRQGRALVRAIESLTTIDPTGPFERTLVFPVRKLPIRGTLSRLL
jgi:hypothetical protein